MRRLGNEQRRLLEEATATYQAQVNPALPYLALRGISESVVLTYRFGFVESPLPGHEHYRGMLVIPYITPTGVIDLKFRQLYDAKPKYMKLPGEAHLYNVMARHKESSVIVITEGELDALVLDGLMGVPAIAVPGADAWKRHYPKCFDGYQRVVIIAEGDDAGKAFANKIHDDLPHGRVVYLPDGLDVNDMYLSDPDGLRERMGL